MFFDNNAFVTTEAGREVARHLHDISSKVSWQMMAMGKTDLVSQYFKAQHNLDVTRGENDDFFTLSMSDWFDRDLHFGALNMDNGTLFDFLCQKTPFEKDKAAWILHVLQEYTQSFSFGDKGERYRTMAEYEQMGRGKGIMMLYDVRKVEDACRFLTFCVSGGEKDLADYFFNLKSDLKGVPYTMECTGQERELYDGVTVTPLYGRTLLVKGLKGKTLEVFEKVRQNWADITPFLAEGEKGEEDDE